MPLKQRHDPHNLRCFHTARVQGLRSQGLILRTGGEDISHFPRQQQLVVNQTVE